MRPDFRAEKALKRLLSCRVGRSAALMILMNSSFVILRSYLVKKIRLLR